MKKISIITPCYNCEDHIKETVLSVLRQSAVLEGRVELEYLIFDGGSSDKTVQVIESIKSPYVKLVSEKDQGMYDALGKGLQAANGDIVAYINAGDYYHKNAFDIVLDIFEKFEVQWLTGFSVAYNERSDFVRCILPFKYRKGLIASGAYGRYLPYIQQESTFWSSKLHAELDYTKLAKFKYAGDYYMWTRFAKKAKLSIVQAYLGGFKYHGGQLSENLKDYKAEVKSVTRWMYPHEYLAILYDNIIWWFMPACVKKFLNRRLYQYSRRAQEWR